jgi:hypothetical protein
MTDTGSSNGAGTPEPVELFTPIEPTAPIEPTPPVGPAVPEAWPTPEAGPAPEPVPAPPQPDPVLSEAERAEAAARKARVRRNVLRWTGAVVLTLAVGGGVAFAISVPQRTDIPGLSTPADGRYAFPALGLPTLPAGQPAPSASANLSAQQHLADIRTLLLPKPDGATASGVKSAGWMQDAYTLFSNQNSKVVFAEYGFRHAATTAWTSSDGATTKIYLLQFSDGPAAASADGALAKDFVSTNGATGMSSVLSGVESGAVTHSLTLTDNVTADYATVTANGKITRYGAFIAGDVVAVVIQSGPAGLPLAPFAQVLTLQAELLQ